MNIDYSIINKKYDCRQSKTAKPGLVQLCDWINTNYKNTKNIELIEIGSFSGISTLIFSYYFKKVICIDAWTSNYDPTNIDAASDPNKYNMKEVENHFDKIKNIRGNIIKIKNWSEEAVKEFDDNSIEVCYIDAGHFEEAITKDICNYYPKIKNNGIICFHDYNNQKWHPDVKKVVDSLLGIPDVVFPDTSALFLKQNIKKNILKKG